MEGKKKAGWLAATENRAGKDGKGVLGGGQEESGVVLV